MELEDLGEEEVEESDPKIKFFTLFWDRKVEIMHPYSIGRRYDYLELSWSVNVKWK